MKYVLYSNINSNISLPLSYALYWSSFLLSSLQHEKRCLQEGGRRRTFWKPSLNDSLNPVNLIIINLVLRIDSIQFATVIALPDCFLSFGPLLILRHRIASCFLSFEPLNRVLLREIWVLLLTVLYLDYKDICCYCLFASIRCNCYRDLLLLSFVCFHSMELLSWSEQSSEHRIPINGWFWWFFG